MPIYRKDKNFRIKHPNYYDENFIWPKLLPMPTKFNGKKLIKELEKEENEKMRALKSFEFPNFKTGDLIKVYMLNSLGELKGNYL